MNIRLLQTNRTCSRSVSYHFNSSLITNSTPTAWLPSSPPSSPTHIRLTGLFHSRSSNSELKNRICEFQLVIDTEVFLTSLMFLSLNRTTTQPRGLTVEMVCVCVFPGGPGSGKSLQCQRMEERFGLRHMTLGDLLCNELQSQSERGRHLREMLEGGEQLPRVSAAHLKNTGFFFFFF